MTSKQQDWETYERHTTIATAVIEDDDHFVYLSVQEFYVGLHESSGGNGLRTTRYEFHMGDDDEGGIDVKLPITPWQMVAIGRAFLNSGLDQFSKQIVAIADMVDQDG